MKQRFCLDSVTSFRDINSSHTNRSKTKQTFSFAKSPRFQSLKSNCKVNSYAGQGIKRKNSGAGLGYGKRSDFTKCLTVSPSSSKYNLKSKLDESLHNKKGASIGLGRDKVLFDSYVDKQIIKVPGAGTYNQQKKLKQQAPLYSMRRKTNIINKKMTIQSQNVNPGPGTYNNPELNMSSSSNHASKFARISFSSSRSKRFDSFDNKIPGPGKYKDDSVTNLSKVGRYVISSHHGGTKAKFDSSRKVSKFDEVANAGSYRPGPGNYRLPSQFGQYDGNVYNNYQTIDTAIASRRNSKY